MRRVKTIRICFIIIAVVCVLGCCIPHLIGSLSARKAGPGTDMEAIKRHLSWYSNDPEEHAKIKDLAVISDYPGLEKLEPWYDFAEKVRRGEPAWITMVDYTIEGDSIFYYLNYDGTEFLWVQDTTRDQFGFHVYLAEKYTKLYEFTEENDSGIEVYYPVLSNVELTSMAHEEQVFWEVYAETEAGTYDPTVAEYQRFPYVLFSAKAQAE